MRSAIKHQELRNEIDKIVADIIENYHPELIILFGSCARGEDTPQSDVDLLVVKKTRKRPIWRRVELRKAINTEIPIDIVVYTPKEFLILQEEGSPVWKSILQEAQVLYERKQ